MMNSTLKESESFPAHLVDEPQESSESIDDKSEVSSSSVLIEPIHPSIFRSLEQENFDGPNTGSSDQSIPKSCVVSFSCDEDGDICLDTPNHDACTPLDYRRDWSIDCQSSLQKIFRANDALQETSYDLLKCDSIASIDMESDCDEDFNSEPVGEWIDNEGIMW